MGVPSSLLSRAEWRWLGQPPREIAAALCENLNRQHFSSVDIAGPGFINLTLSNEYLTHYCQQLLAQGAARIRDTDCAQSTIVIDYSSPNIAKEMHVGHLRSTIIGDCLANAFSQMGYQVKRLNHVGDYIKHFYKY